MLTRREASESLDHKLSEVSRCPCACSSTCVHAGLPCVRVSVARRDLAALKELVQDMQSHVPAPPHSEQVCVCAHVCVCV